MCDRNRPGQRGSTGRSGKKNSPLKNNGAGNPRHLEEREKRESATEKKNSTGGKKKKVQITTINPKADTTAPGVTAQRDGLDHNKKRCTGVPTVKMSRTEQRKRRANARVKKKKKKRVGRKGPQQNARITGEQKKGAKISP